MLVSNYEITLNGEVGNGIFLIDQAGQLSPKSIHKVDLSYIDILNSGGVKNALLLQDGKYLVIGKSSNTPYDQRQLVRLLNNGTLDHSFTPKNLRTGEGSSPSFLYQINDNEIILAANQTEYNGEPSTGINKIDLNGQIIHNFQIELYGPAFINGLQKIDENNLFIYGDFHSSKLSDKSGFTAYNTNGGGLSYSWLTEAGLSKGSWLHEAKILQNGDLIYSSNEMGGGLLTVVDSIGNINRLSPNYPNGITSTKSVNIIDETENHIYVAGKFIYGSHPDQKFHLIKLNKDYSIDEDFSPYRANKNEHIRYVFVDKHDKIIVQYTSHTDRSDLVVRLNSDGSKDATFKDIDYGAPDYGYSYTRVVCDSLILAIKADYNNLQTAKLYDLEGNLIKNNLFTINAGGHITDIHSLSDSTFIISGNFNEISSTIKNGMAIINFNGSVYNELNIPNITEIDQFEIINDTMYIAGEGNIGRENLGGFYAVNIKPDSVILNNIEFTIDGEIKLSWQNNSSFHYFYVVKEDINGNLISKDYVPSGTYEFTDTMPIVNQEVKYIVYSYNVLGFNESSISVKLIKPEAPTSLKLEHSSGDNQLSWADNSDNETSFEIYRSADDMEFNKIAEVEANSLSYTDIAIPLQHTYHYFIKATSENYISDNSNTIGQIAYPPEYPEIFFEIDRENVDIDISWTNESLAIEQTEFVLYESINEGEFKEIYSSVDTTYKRDLIEFTDRFSYNVVAKNIYGEAKSRTININTPILSNEEILSDITIYPNPSTGVINIQDEKSSISSISLYSLNGVLIKTLATKKQQVHYQFKNIAQGLYLILLTDQNGEKAHYKVLVN